MRIKIARNYWFQVLDYYLNILNYKFLHKPLTPVVQRQILLELEKAIAESRKVETHPVWHVPLTVKFNIEKNYFFIEPTIPTDIEIT